MRMSPWRRHFNSKRFQPRLVDSKQVHTCISSDHASPQKPHSDAVRQFLWSTAPDHGATQRNVKPSLASSQILSLPTSTGLPLGPRDGATFRDTPEVWRGVLPDPFRVAAGPAEGAADAVDGVDERVLEGERQRPVRAQERQQVDVVVDVGDGAHELQHRRRREQARVGRRVMCDPQQVVEEDLFEAVVWFAHKVLVWDRAAWRDFLGWDRLGMGGSNALLNENKGI